MRFCPPIVLSSNVYIDSDDTGPFFFCRVFVFPLFVLHVMALGVDDGRA